MTVVGIMFSEVKNHYGFIFGNTQLRPNFSLKRSANGLGRSTPRCKFSAPRPKSAEFSTG